MEGVVNGFGRGFACKSTGLADESDNRREEEEIRMTGWCHFLESRSLRERSWLKKLIKSFVLKIF